MTEEESDVELNGIRPAVVTFFMILISLFVSLGILPMSIILIMSFGEGDMFQIFMDDYLLFAFSPAVLVPLSICNIAYLWKIACYYRGNCTRDFVIWVGLLSVILPYVYAFALFRFITFSETALAISPIWLPFISGIIFMYKKPGPEYTSPWQGDLTDLSWWGRQIPDWWFRMFPSSKDDETKVSETESKSERMESE